MMYIATSIKRLIQNSENKYKTNSIDDHTDPIDIVNCLNNFFVDIGPNLANSITNSELELELNIPNIPFMELEPAQPDDVLKLLTNISDSKATGDDGIPVRFLKICLETTAPLITHIINNTITKLTVPEEWKKAIITPLFKEGDKNSPSNYRPISILPVISKILEKK